MDRGEPTVASRRQFDDIGEELADRGVRFDPMGGRPMREWVVVLAPHVKRWKARMESALASVAGSA